MSSTNRPQVRLDKCACGGWKYATATACTVCAHKRESLEARGLKHGRQ